MSNQCQDKNCHLDREFKMVVCERINSIPTVWCDPCIASIVKALNDAGLHTVVSCCGHKSRPSRITLKDGRDIFIARDMDDAMKIDGLFDGNINTPPEPMRK